MRNVLIDTNTYGAFLRGDPAILESFSKADTIFLSTFVMGELHAGFRGGSLLRPNLEKLEHFIKKPSVRLLFSTAETAEVYGQLMDTLRRNGTPVPINDVWIGAHAIESSSVLITYDRHFLKIPGVRLWPELA